jgi:uncharacterized protein (DUF2141 family)
MALFALASAWGLSTAAAACEGPPTVYPDDSKRFLAPRGKLLRVRTPTKAPVSTACFFLPKPGYYAVAVYHDENGDHKFNRTLVGLPAEGFGFSNDPSTATGLPAFKSVRFQVGADETEIHLKLRYLR